MDFSICDNMVGFPTHIRQEQDIIMQSNIMKKDKYIALALQSDNYCYQNFVVEGHYNTYYWSLIIKIVCKKYDFGLSRLILLVLSRYRFCHYHTALKSNQG